MVLGIDIQMDLDENETFCDAKNRKKISVKIGLPECDPLIGKNIDWGLKQSLVIQATVQPNSVLTKASIWYEIRVLWAMINYVKSHTMTMAFILQADINQIFQMRYCTLL